MNILLGDLKLKDIVVAEYLEMSKIKLPTEAISQGGC